MRRAPGDVYKRQAFKFTKPDEDDTQSFMDILAANKVNARLRRSRGKDIDAACGQLANKG